VAHSSVEPGDHAYSHVSVGHSSVEPGDHAYSSGLVHVYMCIQVTKFKTILDNATRADSIVRQKFDSNTAAMQLLSKGEEEIRAALPAAGAQGAVASGSQVREDVCISLSHQLGKGRG